MWALMKYVFNNSMRESKSKTRLRGVLIKSFSTKYISTFARESLSKLILFLGLTLVH